MAGAGAGEIGAVLAAHMGDPASGFSVGALGALAEFHRAAGEALTLDDRDRLRVATGRGALATGALAGVAPVAYEYPAADGESWRHGVVFCLPAARARGARRRTLTELGADAEAVRPEDRAGLLFDLGVGAANVDFCVRSADPALVAALRAAAGRPVFEAGNPVMDAILEANPHRVAVSALARAEVYQPIGRTKTPEGPHTHLLPELLRTGRSHAATVPVPDGMLPCLSLHPANPLLDGSGRPRPFDRDAHSAFQRLAGRWAAPDYAEEKRRVLAALDSGIDPAAFAPARTRLGRAALKVALRQLLAEAGGGPQIAAWRRAFDRRGRTPAAARRR